MATITRQPELASFLAGIPDDDCLVSLKDQFGSRARLMAAGQDQESRAWSALYSFLEISLETALVQRRTGITL